MEYYLHTRERVMAELGTSPGGLTPDEAELRLVHFGKNLSRRAPARLFGLSALDALQLPAAVPVLALAAWAFYMRDMPSCAVFCALAVLRLIPGTVRYIAARKAARALEPPAETVTVRRNGAIHIIGAEALVPGDIILLKAGDILPADVRLLETHGLKTDETALAGVRIVREKDARALALESGTRLTDRDNMAYRGAKVISGRGEGVVTATGEDVAHPPAQGKAARERVAPVRELHSLALRRVCAAVSCAGAVIFAVGLLREGSAIGPLAAALSLVAAAAPFSLPCAASVQLCLSSVRMRAEGMLVNRDSAAQSAGGIQVICTGMSALTSGVVLDAHGAFGDENLLATAFFLCNNSRPGANGQYVGDPVELALRAYAVKRGITPQSPRVGEATFDTGRRMMSTVHEAAGGVLRQYTKGAPDAVLERCGSIFWSGRVEPLTDALREQALEMCSALAAQHLLVIGAAWRDYEAEPFEYSPEELEKGMTFIGLCGLDYPLREGISSAVRRAGELGARTVLVTGEHPDAACAAAQTLGLFESGGRAITGEALAALSDYELDERLDSLAVYARVLPGQRERIVRAHNRRGRAVAITGASPDDTAALADADLGLAFGCAGTQIARQSADAVLERDEYEAIVSAIAESRRMSEAIRRAAQYMLAAGLALALTALAAAILGLQLLPPAQIIALALLLEALPVSALVFMRSTEAGTPARGRFWLWLDIAWQSALAAALTLYSHWLCGASAAFVTMALGLAALALNARTGSRPIWRDAPAVRQMRSAAGAMAALAPCAVYVPPIASALGLVPPDISRLCVAAALALVTPVVCEAVRLVERKRSK